MQPVGIRKRGRNERINEEFEKSLGEVQTEERIGRLQVSVVRNILSPLRERVSRRT